MRAWESEEELYYFRSQIPMVYSIKFDKEDLCADVFTYLQSGFEITYMSPECCACIWDEIEEDFSQSYWNLKQGEQLFLSYCSEKGISYEALEEEVGTYVPDVMGRWKRGTVVDSNTENTPLIPEHMEMELGFDSGKYPAEIPEKEALTEFVMECHIQVYAKRWEDFNFEIVMLKNQEGSETDIAALISCYDEMAFFEKGKPCRQTDILPANATINAYFLQYLKDGYRIEYMSVSIHSVIWEELSYERPQYLKRNQKEIQMYMEFCGKQGVTKEGIEQILECNIPDFMEIWQSMEKKPAEKKGQQDRREKKR